MKTIVHVILSLEIGGMEQVVSQLLLNLDRKRFNPVVVCLNSLGPFSEELRERGITVVKLPAMTSVLSYLLPYGLMKVIKEVKADIVHVHSGCWHKAAMAGFLSGVGTIIYTDHGRHCPDIASVIRLDRVFSRITTHVVGVSQDIAEYMVRVVGVPNSKIRCIINGIAEDKFSVARRAQEPFAGQLGIIARLSPEKDVATLIRAFKLLHDDMRDVTLKVVGDGEERGMLEQLAESLGLAGSVHFLGFRRDIPEVLADIDIFVLSSLSEGTSITLLEAMASGKPVVVTNVGGNPAVVRDGINGCIVPPADPAALASALRGLLADRVLREKMSAANIRCVHEHFSLKSMTSAYESLYGSQ